MEEHSNIQVKASRFEHIVKKAYRRFVFPCVRHDCKAETKALVVYLGLLADCRT